MVGKTRLNLDNLRQYHAEGLHPSEIAVRMGVSTSTVETQLILAGLSWEKKKGGCKETDEDIQQEILNIYYNEVKPDGKKWGATSIARRFNIDKGTVYNILNKKGQGTRSVASRRKPHEGRKHRQSQRDDMVKNLCAENHSITEIAAATGLTEEGVRYSLRKQKLYVPDDSAVLIRQKIRQYVPTGYHHDPELREDVFDVLTEEAAYWCGFLMGDGHIHIHPGERGQPRIFLNIQRGDKQHLEKLKIWLGTACAIGEGEHQFSPDHNINILSANLKWTSQRHASKLIEYGMTPLKPTRYVSPVIFDNRHFWRGLLDADGCLQWPGEGWRPYLCGHSTLMPSWVEHCETVTGVKGCVEVSQRPGVLIGEVNKNVVAKVIAHAYQEASVILDRKKEQAAAWINEYEMQCRGE